jgi:uncharacterized protein YndB with AHSA1/START domain
VIVLTIVLALVVMLMLGRILLGRRLVDARSILLNVPRERAWETVRDFGALHARHGRGRPGVEITQSVIKSGDGLQPGSIVRQNGRWCGRPYWVEFEVLEVEPPRHLVARLLRDSQGTHRGISLHRVELNLDPDGPGMTRLTWRLSVRLESPSILLARFLSPERMRTRSLDLGLRSLKLAIDGHGRLDRVPMRGMTPIPPRRRPAGSATLPLDLTLSEPPQALDPLRDRP